MSASPPPGPPYLNWSLDRWKLVVLSILLVMLTLSALLWVRQPAATEPPPVAVTVAPAPIPTETGVAPTQVELALTLANVAPNMVAEVSSVQVLSGTAEANSQVDVRQTFLSEETAATVHSSPDDAQSLGVAAVDASGLWQLELSAPLAAGQHLIVAQQRSDGGEVVAQTPTLVLTLVEAAPADDPADDPAVVAAPQILEPAAGQRLASSALRFRGRGLAGSRVQLFVNERFAGDGTVQADGGWQIDPASPLPAGSYVGRVALLNPFGRITAESASTAFVVEGAGEGRAVPVPWKAPLVPLQVTAWPPAGGEGCAGSLAGLATPSSSVIVLANSQPLVARNVQRDMGWYLNLPPGLTADCSALSVVSNLGESVALAPFYTAGVPPLDATAYQPVFVDPQNGQTLSTRRPLLRGVARPASPVSVVVNDRLVATVQADPAGQWAYQTQSDLTGDEAVFEAYVAADDGSVLAATAPVVVVLGE